MRRPLNWVVLGFWLLGFMAGSALPGCGRNVSPEVAGGAPTDVTGMVRSLRSVSDLEELLEGGLGEVPVSAEPAGSVSLPLVDLAIEAGEKPESIESLDISALEEREVFGWLPAPEAAPAPPGGAG